MIKSTTNSDIEDHDIEGVFSSTNGDIDLERCTGVCSTTNGDITLVDCNMECSTTNGNVHSTNHVGSISTTNGDITLYGGTLDNVKTTNGIIKLNNTLIKECEGYVLKGNGSIDHLTLLTRNCITKINSNFNLFKPSTWFNDNSINISVDGFSVSCDGDITINNDEIYVNGKKLETDNEQSSEQIWEVPKNIKIKRITTKMTVISDYDIEIDGGGKLQKKVAFL